MELTCAKCNNPAEGYCPVCGKYYCSKHASMDPAVVDPGIENDAGLVGVLCEDCKWLFYDKETGTLDRDKVIRWEEENGIRIRPGWAVSQRETAKSVESAFAEEEIHRKHKHTRYEYEYEVEES